MIKVLIYLKQSIIQAGEAELALIESIQGSFNQLLTNTQNTPITSITIKGFINDKILISFTANGNVAGTFGIEFYEVVEQPPTTLQINQLFNNIITHCEASLQIPSEIKSNYNE